MQPRPSTRGPVFSLLERMGPGDVPAESPSSSPTTLTGTSAAALSCPGPDDEVGEKKFVDYFQAPWTYLTVGKSTAELDKVIVDGDDAVVLATFHNTADACLNGGGSSQTGRHSASKTTPKLHTP